MRTVILHYHLFKNAGTSVDAILQKNFPGRWLTAEFSGQDNRAAVGDWIRDNPDASAFSSHTAQFPLPEIDGVEIFPIVFLRHPLDRIRSAYAFERQQISEGYGARLAKTTDLAGYIRTRLGNHHDRQCRNFQTSRLSRLVPGPINAELDRSLEALGQLPFVGIVEEFGQSIGLLETLLKPCFPEFRSVSTRKNVNSEENSALADRTAMLRTDLGPDLFRELLEANLKDICLHHAGLECLPLRSGLPVDQGSAPSPV